MNSRELNKMKIKCIKPDSETFVLIQNDDNLGFAKGNNIGIKYALEKEFPYILILNNDTYLAKDFTKRMINFMDKNPEIGISTPCIYCMGNGRVWNFGGILTFFGSHIYYNSNIIARRRTGYYPITFITGCAFFARKEIFEKYGLFIEDYFFGEEDYEYSIRMRNNNVKMAGVLEAIISHKEGSSSRKLIGKEINFYFIHHLNRLVHMKKYYVKPIWHFWRFIVMIYIFFFFINALHLNLKLTIIYIRKQIQYSNILMKVDKEPFMRIMQERF